MPLNFPPKHSSSCINYYSPSKFLKNVLVQILDQQFKRTNINSSKYLRTQGGESGGSGSHTHSHSSSSGPQNIKGSLHALCRSPVRSLVREGAPNEWQHLKDETEALKELRAGAAWIWNVSQRLRAKRLVSSLWCYWEELGHSWGGSSGSQGQGEGRTWRGTLGSSPCLPPSWQHGVSSFALPLASPDDSDVPQAQEQVSSPWAEIRETASQSKSVLLYIDFNHFVTARRKANIRAIG